MFRTYACFEVGGVEVEELLSIRSKLVCAEDAEDLEEQVKVLRDRRLKWSESLLRTQGRRLYNIARALREAREARERQKSSVVQTTETVADSSLYVTL